MTNNNELLNGARKPSGLAKFVEWYNSLDPMKQARMDYQQTASDIMMEKAEWLLAQEEQEYPDTYLVSSEKKAKMERKSPKNKAWGECKNVGKTCRGCSAEHCTTRVYAQHPAGKPPVVTPVDGNMVEGLETALKALREISFPNYGAAGQIARDALEKIKYRPTPTEQKPVDDLGLMEALKNRIDFEIGLYGDAINSKAQALILEQAGGGFRLSNYKATGSWDKQKVFKCSASIDEMFPEILSRHDKQGTEGK